MKATEIKKIYAQITINASSETVWKIITGERFIYQWCKAFSTFSYIDSSWAEGDMITYVSTPGVGLVGKITKRAPKAIVIEYVRMPDGVSQVEGEGETYSVEMADNHSVMLTITADVDSSHFDIALREWNTALDSIKQIAESLSNGSRL